MAGEFLRTHGIDLNAEMDRIQHGSKASAASPIDFIVNASLPGTAPNSRHNVHLSANAVASLYQHRSQETTGTRTLDANGAVVTPSLCHPHIHIDKAFLLSHPKYSHLQLQRGDFAEAMELTGKAKAMFDREDLLERGQRLVDESVSAGVTHMRVFVEVDAGVGMKCLDAGIELKRRAEEAGRCVVQICAFAQLPLFTSSKDDPEGQVIKKLMEEAASKTEVGVVGSTPYVESDRKKMEQNVEFMINLSAQHQKHLDFHLDYNLDPNTEPMVWHVISALKSAAWNATTAGKRTVVLGHCTRLTMFSDDEWHRLASEIREADLPISFVGLPTSDMFIMPHPPPTTSTRRTLDVPRMIKDFGLNACLGVNNIGNAFTPQGSCDPLTLACNGVGIYQVGTKADAELLFECVSTRARAAIGFGRDSEPGDVSSEVREGDRELLVFGSGGEGWRTRGSVSEAVYLYDQCRGRRIIRNGRLMQ